MTEGLEPGTLKSERLQPDRFYQEHSVTRVREINYLKDAAFAKGCSTEKSNYYSLRHFFDYFSVAEIKIY